MMRGEYSRRTFIRNCAASGMVALGIQAITSCGKSNDNSEKSADAKSPASCDDLSGVSETDLANRKKLGYVEKSPLADNQCQNCNLYLPPKEGEKCGGCMLFKGPVFPEAYCTYWAPKI